MNTAGEKLVGRVLEKEKRGGVTHYVTGQHHAELIEHSVGDVGIDETVVRLSYVDTMGHAVAVVVARYEGDDTWHPITVASAGQTTGPRPALPGRFRLSENMLRAIEKAAP